MFFDATAKHDGSVVAAVEKLFGCCVATEKTAANDKPMPPLVVFNWGQITSFPAYVTSVSAKYTLFSADGTPIRAVCTRVAAGDAGREGQAEPDVRRARRPQHPHHGGGRHAWRRSPTPSTAIPTMWRSLANFNRIDDPMRIPLGSVLMLPSAAELAELVGPVI